MCIIIIAILFYLYRERGDGLMAYKLLIVDDEKTIREGLAKIVNWGSMGFEVASILADGRDAIQYIQSHHIDVILTDITMTFVSGLDLAKYVYENMPQIKVVLITGYKEFEYAKRAISYNVVHYLLKPTQLNELNDVFEKLKQQLDKEQEEKRQIGDVMPLLQEQFFSDLIMGALRNREEITKWIKIIGMDINPELTQCALINIHLPDYNHHVTETWKYGKDSFYSAIRNFLHTETNTIQFLPVYNTGENIFVMAIAFEQMDKIAMQNELASYFADTRETVKELLNIQIEIVIERMYKNIFDIAESHILPHKTQSVNGELPEKDKKDTDYKRLLEQQKVLISYISDGNGDSVLNIFETIVDELGDMNFELFRDFVFNLFVLLENKLKDLGIELYFDHQHHRDYKQILSMENSHEIISWGKSLLTDMVAFVQENRGKSESKFVQTIKDYIHANYHDDISLEDAANYVFLSASHFGRIFKKQFGENFSDYLIKFRMQKAMDLLKNPDYKVYEISEMVGYKTLKYFYKLFKQNTGFTPTEYRVQCINKAGNVNE